MTTLVAFAQSRCEAQHQHQYQHQEQEQEQKQEKEKDQQEQPKMPQQQLDFHHHEALASMYADLSGQKHSDPAAYRTRIAWWAETIADACWYRIEGLPHTLCWHVDEHVPMQWAMKDVGRPMCLSVVVDELASQTRLIRMNEFFARKTPLTAPNRIQWIGSQIWRWFFSRGDCNSDQSADEALWPAIVGEWVVRKNVERAARLFQAQHDRHTSLVQRVMPRSQFKEMLSTLKDENRSLKLSDVDKDILLLYLERDARVIVRDNDVVKLCREHVLESSESREYIIGEQERGIVAVKSMQAQLASQIDDLQQRIECAHENTVRAFKTKQRESVTKSHLRTKKQLEDMLEKRVQAEQTLNTLLLKMEQAASDADMMHTFEASERTVRALLNDPVLQPERIDSTMDALAESLAKQDEVRASVTSEAMHAETDEDTLADELRKLELDVTQSADAAPDAARIEPTKSETLQMPSVPSHTPPMPSKERIAYENSM